jgi:arabinan endo-1,5-alpha-L-arabinosidase
MKSAIVTAALAALAWTPSLLALDGTVGIHDPSTVIQCDGKWYTWGTGGTPLVSDDGWTWRAGIRPLRTGAAPDVIKVGDRYYMYISGVTMIWSKSLDPDSQDYKWEEGGQIAGRDSDVDVNPIDPGAFLDPNDGKLWMTFGSYVGHLQVVELDPKTGQRVQPAQKPVSIAINCEASTMIFHDGWYYVLATHGSCCAGANSGYHIVVGRSKKPTGPFVDNMGIDMMKGGGKVFATSSGRWVGPGHFGLIEPGDGVQKFSLHYEADLDRGGASVLDIRPVVWRDGWPEAGDNAKPGTYNFESFRNGKSLELAVQAVPVAGGGRGGGGAGRGGGGRGAPPAPGAATQPAAGGAPAGGPPGGRGGGGLGRGGGAPIPDQDVAQVSKDWPDGNVGTRLSNYMLQAQQKWAIAPAPEGGGYLGSPYFKITVAGTDRTLTATKDGELVVMPSFSGAPEQLWRLDQLPDGTYRIGPKAVPDSKDAMYLSAVGSGLATLNKYDAKSDKQHWRLRAP